MLSFRAPNCAGDAGGGGIRLRRVEIDGDEDRAGIFGSLWVRYRNWIAILPMNSILRVGEVIDIHTGFTVQFPRTQTKYSASVCDHMVKRRLDAFEQYRLLWPHSLSSRPRVMAALP